MVEHQRQLCQGPDHFPNTYKNYAALFYPRAALHLLILCYLSIQRAKSSPYFKAHCVTATQDYNAFPSVVGQSQTNSPLGNASHGTRGEESLLCMPELSSNPEPLLLWLSTGMIRVTLQSSSSSTGWEVV